MVGVDGSEGSEAALRWAVEEAGFRDAVVEVVHGWTYPFAGEATGMASMTVDGAELERGAAALVRSMIDAVPSSVTLEPVVVRGAPAAALLRAADDADADLLVVGSRGRGGFTGLLLGSVSQQVVHHAACPVVVIPRR